MKAKIKRPSPGHWSLVVLVVVGAGRGWERKALKSQAQGSWGEGGVTWPGPEDPAREGRVLPSSQGQVAEQRGPHRIFESSSANAKLS